MTNVITRIAPSPTGEMHLGTARTALFNYLYTKHTGGKFKLRIEDTDRERSTPEAVKTIFDGLKWLGLDYDGVPVKQTNHIVEHVAIADELVRGGEAYRCYLTPDEASSLKKEGTAFRSPWRDKTSDDYLDGVPYVVRFKGPLTGETVVHDLVKGDVTFANENLDDLVLLRSDGTPTYNLSVVVDDHEMGVNFVIRGDDHLNNTPRQMLIYKALGWPVPAFAHLSLIYGEDGKKLAKRHGAASVMDFADLGYLPETMRNYLVRLGWGHDDSEIFSDADAIKWFDVKDVVSAPARLDMKKLNHMNAHYIMEADDHRLADLVRPYLERKNVKYLPDLEGSMAYYVKLFKPGATTLPKIADAMIFAISEISYDEKATAILADPNNKNFLVDIINLLEYVYWHPDSLNALIHSFSESSGIPMKKIGPPMRAALTGTTVAPDLGTCLAACGRKLSITRLKRVI